VTVRNFGRDRRYPITNRFRDSAKAPAEPNQSLVLRSGRASVGAFEG
jgi:NAD+ synthase